jgi:F-type H+-transporting ATPase subunit epsilon
MSQKLLNLTIAKVDAAVFREPVRSVTLPGSDGALTLLANHEPFITPLTAGDITIETETGETTTIAISEGTLEVSHNTATVLI